MIKAYHVDRAGTCREGLIFQLDDDGLSRHGKRYSRPFLYPPYTQGEWESGKLNELTESLIEHFFELYRAAYFPDRPSRFSIWFGVDPNDAPYWLNRQGFKGHPVWLVETPSAFRADASLLEIFSSSDGRRYFNPVFMRQFAEYYWSGKTLIDLLTDCGEQVDPELHKPQWELLLSPPVRVVSRV